MEKVLFLGSKSHYKFYGGEIKYPRNSPDSIFLGPRAENIWVFETPRLRAWWLTDTKIQPQKKS